MSTKFAQSMNRSLAIFDLHSCFGALSKLQLKVDKFEFAGFTENTLGNCYCE